MREWRSARGQATSEYVGLVTLVAVVLTLAAGLTSGGVGSGVLAGLQRGLCRVVPAGCPRPQPQRADLEPCPLERSARRELLDGAFEVVRVAGGASLSAVRLSDGRVVVTLSDDTSAGAEVGVGAHVETGRGGLHAMARARLAAIVASGRSWTLPDAAAARSFVARHGARGTIRGRLVDLARSGCSLLCDALGWRPHRQLPPPDELQIGAGAVAELSSSLGPLGLSRSAKALRGARLGRDGTSTWYLELDASARAALDLPLGGLGAASTGQAVVSYALDARRRPRTLAIQVAGQTGLDAAGRAAARGAHAIARAGGAQVTEVEATLDLRDPANRAAAAALVEALGDPRALASVGARAALVRERLARSGTIDRRTYALASSALAFGGGLGLGAQIGGGFERTAQGMRLLRAETRLPGLPFLPRDDCRVG